MDFSKIGGVNDVYKPSHSSPSHRIELHMPVSHHDEFARVEWQELSASSGLAGIVQFGVFFLNLDNWIENGGNCLWWAFVESNR
jgi:hypothetical protein